MGFYDDMREIADELLEEFGGVIQVERIGESGTWQKKFDAATSRVYWEDAQQNVVYTAPDGVTTTTSGYGVVDAWPLKLIDGTLIQQGDVLAFLSVSVEVEEGDKLILPSSKEFIILPPIERVEPDGSTRVVQIVNARGDV
nr:hypothetical protein 13 [bacterium]